MSLLLQAITALSILESSNMQSMEPTKGARDRLLCAATGITETSHSPATSRSNPVPNPNSVELARFELPLKIGVVVVSAAGTPEIVVRTPARELQRFPLPKDSTEVRKFELTTKIAKVHVNYNGTSVAVKVSQCGLRGWIPWSIKEQISFARDPKEPKIIRAEGDGYARTVRI